MGKEENQLVRIKHEDNPKNSSLVLMSSCLPPSKRTKLMSREEQIAFDIKVIFKKLVIEAAMSKNLY